MMRQLAGSVVLAVHSCVHLERWNLKMTDLARGVCGATCKFEAALCDLEFCS